MKRGLNMTRSRIVKTGIALAVALAIGGGAYAYMNGKKDTGAATANTVEVTRGRIETVVTAQGKLEPKDYVDVGAEVSGQIKKMHVDVGDAVKSGDLLAEIDPATYEASVKGDQARIKQLEAQQKEQEATYAQTKQKLARNKTLYDNRAVAREVYEDAQTAVNIASAQILSLEAQLEEAQSILEGDQADLERTKIYAPMDGTVVSLSVKEGQTINANQTAPVIGQLARLDVMTVRAQVAEADITKLTADMPVYFTTLGSQGRKWDGRVRQILPSPETVNDVVLYNVLADVDNKDGQLMTGMTTQLFFVLGRADDVLTIPASLLTKRAEDADKDGNRGYVVNVLKGGRPEARTILVGLSDRTTAQVVSGLEDGDRVVQPVSAASPAAAAQGGGQRRGGMPRL